jgi:hypothetical protein
VRVRTEENAHAVLDGLEYIFLGGNRARTGLEGDGRCF